MSIIDDAADIIRPHIKNSQQEPAYSDDNDDHDVEAAAALHRAGMLTQPLRIIRTIEELATLVPETILIDRDGHVDTREEWGPTGSTGFGLNAQYLPAVVVATGGQIAAARKALEEA